MGRSRATRSRSQPEKQSGGRRTGQRSGSSPQPGNHAGSDAAAIRFGPGHHEYNEGLDAKVLVLNKLYVAVRVVNARRAFTLLSRNIAEVIHLEDGQYANYDFESWTELAQLRHEFGERFGHDESGRIIEDWVRTVHMRLPVPRIIRLLGYERLPRQVVKLNRRNLFARDRNQCQYCGKHFPTSELSIDHVIPRMLGGGDSWLNLVCACFRCNARKGGRTPEQARMKLVKPPAQPKRNPMISVRLGQPKYQSWKAFLDEAYWSVELK